MPLPSYSHTYLLACYEDTDTDTHTYEYMCLYSSSQYEKQSPHVFRTRRISLTLEFAFNERVPTLQTCVEQKFRKTLTKRCKSCYEKVNIELPLSRLFIKGAKPQPLFLESCFIQVLPTDCFFYRENLWRSRSEYAALEIRYGGFNYIWELIEIW